jgi:D-sedoheptulose 7-phosphate isomerase
MENTVQSVIEHAAAESVLAMRFLSSPEAILFMADASECLAEAFSSGKKVLIAGNGGSLCDAAHFAEELTGNFRKPRKALPALVLSEPGHLTCVGNDFGFADIFRRGVEAFGQLGDIFIALSTSGNSPNIVSAVREAKARSLRTICLLGKGGGKLLNASDIQLIVPESTTSDRIQEVHMACLHIIIEGVEAILFHGSVL